MMEELLKNCLDEQGRIKLWPKKHARKEAVIRYLASKFEAGRIYTEKEVNAIIDRWHTFGDYFLLRRSLIEANLLKRDPYGRAYERTCAFSDVAELLSEQYSLNVITLEKASLGAGSDTYFAECLSGKYVVKFPCTSEINHPEQEVGLCRHLLAHGIPASVFLNNNGGSALSYDDSGRLFHVQEFIQGNCCALNTASPVLLTEMAEMLGKIHTALRSYPALSTGIGEDFFRFMTPDNALNSYEASLRIARENQDEQNITDLLYRVALVKRLPAFHFSPEKIRCGNTHGDYFISQLLCRDDHISSVIDWTTACVHPYIWEIIRSFVYAAPSCADGVIDAEELTAYVTAYMKYALLTKEDLSSMLPLFFRQLAVCDYYGQYYSSKADNRSIYLHQARFSTKLLRSLENNMESVTAQLLQLL